MSINHLSHSFVPAFCPLGKSEANEIDNTMACVKSAADWIVIDVTDEDVAQAKSIRAARDLQYGNLYSELPTDERWVGDLGEIVLNNWLEQSGLKNFQWIKEGTAGLPDFITEDGIRIGAKTVKRQAAPRLEYTAQISARHAYEPTDWFFFMNCLIAQKKVWLLGAIEAPRFLDQADYHGAGHQVHPNYTIRAGHEIYNIALGELVPPAAWVETEGLKKTISTSVLNGHGKMPMAPNEEKEIGSLFKRLPFAFRPQKNTKKPDYRSLIH